MKQIIYRINTQTGAMMPVEDPKRIIIREYENESTRLVFKFDRAIKESDRLIIMITNAKGGHPYRLARKNSSEYTFDLQREHLVRGRLEFYIQRYDDALVAHEKYSPESSLYVTAGGDITNYTIESRPDLFAEMFYRIEKLEKEIERLNSLV